MPNQRPDLLQSAGHLLGYLNPFQGIESSIRHEIALGIDGTAGSQSLKYPEIWRSLKNPGYRPPARLIDGAQASLSQSAAGGDDPAIGLLAAQHLHQTAADPTTHGWRKAALLAGAGMEAIPSLIPAEAGVALRRPSGVNPAHGPYAPYGGIDAFDAAYQSPTRGSVESGRIQADYGTAPGSTLPRGVWDPAWGPQPTLRPGQQPDLSARPIFAALAEGRAAAAADAILAEANARARNRQLLRDNPLIGVEGPPTSTAAPPTHTDIPGYYDRQGNWIPGRIIDHTKPTPRPNTGANYNLAAAPTGTQTAPPPPRNRRPVAPPFTASQAARYERPLRSPFTPPDPYYTNVHINASNVAQVTELFPGAGGYEEGHPIDDPGTIARARQPFGDTDPFSPPPVQEPPAAAAPPIYASTVGVSPETKRDWKALGGYGPAYTPPNERAAGVASNAPATGPEGGTGDRPLHEWEQGIQRYEDFVPHNERKGTWKPMWAQITTDAAEHEAGTPAAKPVAERRQVAAAIAETHRQVAQLREQLSQGPHDLNVEGDLGHMLSEALDAQMFLTKRYSRLAGFHKAATDAISPEPAPSDARTAGFHDAGYASGRPTPREQRQAIGRVRFTNPPPVWGVEQGDPKAIRKAGGTPLTSLRGPGFNLSPKDLEAKKADLVARGKLKPDADPATLDINDTTPPDFTPPDANGVRAFNPAIPQNLSAVAHAKAYTDGDRVPANLGSRIIASVAAQLNKAGRNSKTLALLTHLREINAKRATNTTYDIGVLMEGQGIEGTRDYGPPTSGTVARTTRHGVYGYPDLGRDLVNVYLESGLAKDRAQAERMAVGAMLNGSKERGGAKSGPGFGVVRIGNTAATNVEPNFQRAETQMRRRTKLAEGAYRKHIERMSTPLDKWTDSGRPVVISYNYDAPPSWADFAPYFGQFVKARTAHTKTVRLVSTSENAGVTRMFRENGFNVELIPPGKAVGEATKGADIIVDPTSPNYIDNIKFYRQQGNRQIATVSRRAQQAPSLQPKIDKPTITYGKTRQQRK